MFSLEPVSPLQQPVMVRWLFPLVAALAVPACASDTSAPVFEDDGDQADTDGSDDENTDSPDDGDSADDPGEDGDPGSSDGDGDEDSGGDDVDATLPLIDASPADAGPPPPEGPYQFLSESGLYTDIVNHVLAPDVVEFEPEFKLWSDAAEKRRWIRLPPGEQIQVIAMDRWRVPRGTTVWKEFADPGTGKRLETRIIQYLASGDFYFASFIWNEDDSEAEFDPTLFPAEPRDIPAGCSVCTTPPCTANPDCHVVPQSNKCNECHGGEVGKLLGFSAVQLSHDGPGMTLTDLVELDLLDNPPAPGVTFPVPGTPVERAAIGYLHANCGHCHSPVSGQTGCHLLTEGLATRVLPGNVDVEDTQVYQTAVGQPLQYWIGAMRGNNTDITDRILPGDASASAIWYRMSVREFGQLPPLNDHQQMPYFFTNEVDEAGLSAVEVWINSLP